MQGDAAIYLDYAASTPPAPEVSEAMAACLAGGGAFANPSSSHALGRAAAARIEEHGDNSRHS